MPLSAKKILLVEDHADTLEIIQLQVRSMGVGTLLTAQSGYEALRIAEEERPDLILMDIVMSKMSGLEATRRLKANPHTSQIPIVAVTAKAMPGDREFCLKSGCDGYLAKPVSSQQLKKAIEKLLPP